MTVSIQALREQRVAIVNSIRDLNDKAPGALWAANPENQKAYDAGMAQLDSINAEVARIEAINEKLKDEFNKEMVGASADKLSHDKKAPGAKLFAKWIRGGDNALSAAEWADVRATMSTTTSGQGGYSVQSDVAAQLIDSLKAFGGMRDVSTILRTGSGNPLSFPGSDGTSEVGELIAENTTATGADPSFTTVSLAAYKFSSKIVAVPFELLQDSQIDIEGFINGRLITRLGRSTNSYFTTGTGSAQPFGVVTQSTSGKVGTTGQTLTVIFDDLVDLVHSVDVAYRTPGCKWMMNDASVKVIRKLKDSQNRPIYLPGDGGLAGGMSMSLLGYDIKVNNDIAVMAANAKSILFGDFSKYYVRDVMDASMFRFTDSAYAKLGQVGFLMWMRAGGNLLDTAAVKYYANSAT